MVHSTSGEVNDHRVVLVKCDDYDHTSQAMARGVDLLGGAANFCLPGEGLLLKPNLLVGDAPERGSTTHPAVFEAAAEVFSNVGARLFYGDSPGFGTPQLAVRSSGMERIAKLFDIRLADFNVMIEMPNPDGLLMKQFQVAKGLTQVDGVINLPKLKTHALTRLTGAVKNLFGCLPGVQKSAFHARLANERHLADMLVDLAELIKPRLHIMDGVLGMEGNGPRNGSMQKVGVILLSTNPHALDYCVARIMNLDPNLVPTLESACENGLFDPARIDILGDPLEGFVIENFDVNRSKMSTTGTQRFYMPLLNHWVTPKPVIDETKCTRCGCCVKICPVTPKALSFQDGRRQSPQYNYDHCIRCYCCQEMCPDEAICIKTHPIGRLLSRLKL